MKMQKVGGVGWGARVDKKSGDPVEGGGSGRM